MVAVPALVFVPVALVRFVDGDEGVYAYASRLAWQGKLPYRDFFYEQTPDGLSGVLERFDPDSYDSAKIRRHAEQWALPRFQAAILATVSP